MTHIITTLLQTAPQCYPCGEAFDANTPGGAVLFLLLVGGIGYGIFRNVGGRDWIFLLFVAIIILWFLGLTAGPS